MALIKDIAGYEGLYKVSTDGFVINTKTNKAYNGWQHDKYGHRKVRLYKNGVAKDYYLHRLVALAFIPNKDNKPHINHIDCNPSNNNVNNLEWCTHLENLQHASRNNRMNRIGNRVINTSTGDIFDSIKTAADSIGMKQNTLVYKLLGKRKNDTNFMLISAHQTKLNAQPAKK